MHQTVVSNRNATKRGIYNPFISKPTDVRASSFLSKQSKQVLDLIRRDGRVTRLTALHYGVANLTARIADLRASGFLIDCEVKLDANGKEYGVWTEGHYLFGN